MTRSPNGLAGPIAQGWMLMFLLFLSILLIELTQAVTNDDLAIFRSDAGRRGLRLLTVLIMVHALVPMLVVSVTDGPKLRWAVFGVTVVLTMVLIAHQIGHLANGEKQLDIFQLLDATHHALGLWVSRLAWRWARPPRAELLQGACA